MDVQRRADRVGDAYGQGAQAVGVVIAQVVGGLAAPVGSLVARGAAWEAENAALPPRMAALAAGNPARRAGDAASRARRATDRPSRRKPPAAEGPGGKPPPKGQRATRGRPPGGQPGHVGHSVTLVDEPDAGGGHAPARWSACGQGLAEGATGRQERRPVVDWPPIKAPVVEQEVPTRCCPRCGSETSGASPPEVSAPVPDGPGGATAGVSLTRGQLLPVERATAVPADLFGCPIAEGTLEAAAATCPARPADGGAALKAGIGRAAAAHFAETGVNVAGETHWRRAASTARSTFDAPHPQRGQAALAASGPSPGLPGRAVHDGRGSYWRYAACAHAPWNGHHPRGLPFGADERGHSWATDLKGGAPGDEAGGGHRPASGARGTGGAGAGGV
jgi:transposase